MMPLLDGRDAEAILEKIKKLAPLYVPEWNFDRENIEPGTVMSVIFSEMLEGTIKRYNQVLQRNRMAFLNMLNAKILPANPSEAYVTFLLSTGAKESALIPRGTMVAADTPDHNGQVVFETAQEMLATPAVPVCAYQIGNNARVVNQVDSKLFSLDEAEKKGFVIFDRKDQNEDHANGNLQEHCIYFSHPEIFNVNAPAEFTLKFCHSKKKYHEKEIYSVFSDSKKCKWQYYSKTSSDNPWTEFKDDCIKIDGDRLILIKKDSCELVKTQLQGVEGNYIRCKLNTDAENNIPDIEFDKVYVTGKLLNTNVNFGVVPDKLFYNDIELKPTEFYPFGVYFSIYDCFYICCKEVLSKKDSIVTLRFTVDYEKNSIGDTEKKKIIWKNIMKKSDLEVPDVYETQIEAVIWEYWNGNSWARLSMEDEYERVFDGTYGAEKDEEQDKKQVSIVFTCPKDIEQAPVNGHFDYYIRGRIKKVWNAYKPNSVYLTPKIKDLALRYEYGKGLPVKSILTKNNMDWKTFLEPTESNIRESEFIKPFEAIGNNYPSLYIGFDIAPVNGPIHLYFSLKKLGDESICFQPVWEYYGSTGWTPLKTIDNTSGFGASGSVVFAGPRDFIIEELFEEKKYWLRVYDKSTGHKTSNIEIDGIFINTERVIQQESIKEEIPEVFADGLKVECRLSRSPIVSEEVFINEASELSFKEQKEILEQGKYEVLSQKDEYGNIKDFWVKWLRVDDFLLSAPDDRHYISDQSSGRIVLNGARYTKGFFKGGKQKIKISYKVGGGAKGNIPAYSIKGLKNSIAFVEKVINHKPSFGGCEMEPLEEAIERETQALRHRDRAVTSGDFEALALHASRNVAKVRCIPNMDANFNRKVGYTALVILPKGGSRRDDFFAALKDEVKSYVLDKTSCVIAFEDKISVMEPVFIEYSVIASVAIEDMNSIIEVEKEAEISINTYLDHQNGNFDKRGWEIGAYPYTSGFFTLLKAVSKVKYIENLIVNVREIRYGKSRLVTLEALENMPYIMIKSGQHHINVKVV